jgi:hypothetical protein
MISSLSCSVSHDSSSVNIVTHCRVDAGLFHLPQRVVLRVDGNLTMSRIGREAVFPDMELRVNNQHGVLLLCCDTVHVLHANPMTCQVRSRCGAL